VHLSAYRYNFCYRPGCPADGPEMLTSAFNADDVRYGLNQGDGRTRLPAGRYHLLVVTDGAPVTVTLRLPGLSGRVALRPQAPARTTETTLTWTAPTPPTPVSTRFSGGTRATFDGHTGEVLSMLDVRHDYSVEEESGFCVYDGAAPPAYLRGCPGGGGVSIGFVGVATTAYRSRAWGSYAGLGDGSYAVGEYYDVTGAAHDPKGAIAAVTYPRGW
jgi:hypothetical protein